MKKRILGFTFLPLLFGMSGCGAGASSEVSKTPIIEWSEETKIASYDDAKDLLSVKLSTSSAVVTVSSKKKNQYEKFRNASVTIWLDYIKEGRYWGNIGTVNLNASGYGTFSSSDLSLLCQYYGSGLTATPSQCRYSGYYSVGTVVGYE